MMTTIKDAQAKVHLPYYTIRRLCLEGKIRFIKSGTKYYIYFESLVQYLRGDKDEQE